MGNKKKSVDTSLHIKCTIVHVLCLHDVSGYNIYKKCVNVLGTKRLHKRDKFLNCRQEKLFYRPHAVSLRSSALYTLQVSIMFIKYVRLSYTRVETCSCDE